MSVLRFTDSDYPFGVFKLFVCRSLFVLLSFSFGHGNVCPWIYGFWLPLWYFQIVCYTYYSITLIFWAWTIDRMHIPDLILKFKIKKNKKKVICGEMFFRCTKLVFVVSPLSKQHYYIMELKINLFLSWYSSNIAERALNNNHAFTHCYKWTDYPEIIVNADTLIHRYSDANVREYRRDNQQWTIQRNW
jgi:hypothetical protein